MKMFKMCLHPKVIAAMVAVAAGVWLVAPGWFTAALPILFLAICPLSMLLMMKMMMPGSARQDATADSSSQESLEEQLRWPPAGRNRAGTASCHALTSAPAGGATWGLLLPNRQTSRL